MFLKRLKIFRSYAILITFLALSGSRLYCQYNPVSTYGVPDGLPQSIINSIRQDCRGFIWICTRNGLARFDGMETVTYFKRDGLASSHVLVTIDDNDNNLWALTTGGLSYFDGNRFIPFPFPENIRIDYPLVCSSADSTFYMLVGLRGKAGRHLFKFKNGIYSVYSENKVFNDSLDILDMEFNSETSSLVASDENNNLLIIKNEDITRVAGFRANDIFNYNKVTVFRSGKRYYRFNRGFPVPISDSLATGSVASVRIYPGIQKDLILNYNSGIDSIRIEMPIEGWSYIVDDEGVLWYFFGSVLTRLIPPLFFVTDQSALPFSGLWAIMEDRNESLWFGSISGRLLKLTGEIFKEIPEFPVNGAENLAFYKGSRRMTDGSTWFSTNNGILIWDGQHFSWQSDIPGETQVCYIFEDVATGKILVGTQRGLYILNNGKVTLLEEFNDSGLGVVEGVARNDWGGYWISGHRGLVRLDGEVATPVRFPGLPEENTFTLVSDKEGGLWITSDEGLWHRDSRTGEYVAALPDEINMPANSIHAIDDNRIIVGRAADICLIYLDRFYSNEKDYFRVYDRTDGFTSGVCLDNGIISTSDGKVWILTDNEIIKVNPDAFRINQKPPKLHITGFYYRNDSNKLIRAEAGDLFRDNPSLVNLNRNQNNIRISFTGISTSNPEKVRYSHRLTGYEKEWSTPGGSRFLDYDNLSPGNYMFEIMAINADGIRTSEPQRIFFRINPAIWQRPVFIIFVSLLSLLLTAFLTWFFIRKNQKEKEESQRLRIALSRLQLKALLGQFDPHFTFNVISSLGSLVMKNEKEAAYEYITRLSNLLRSSIGGERLIIITLEREIELVKDYCELHKLRFRDRFNYEITVDQEVDQERLIPRMTIQSFVENSIKHGIENKRSGGNLWIGIKKLTDSVEIIIRDNGIGLASAGEQNTKGTGTGLKTITLLFDYINRFFDARCFYEISDIIEKDKSSGTLVRILIPDICDFNILVGKEGDTGYQEVPK